MSILKEHISHMEKEQLNAQQSELTAFFLTALDFRAEHCQVSHTNITECFCVIFVCGPDCFHVSH